PILFGFAWQYRLNRIFRDSIIICVLSRSKYRSDPCGVRAHCANGFFGRFFAVAVSLPFSMPTSAILPGAIVNQATPRPDLTSIFTSRPESFLNHAKIVKDSLSRGLGRSSIFFCKSPNGSSPIRPRAVVSTTPVSLTQWRLAGESGDMFAPGYGGRLRSAYTWIQCF